MGWSPLHTLAMEANRSVLAPPYALHTRTWHMHANTHTQAQTRALWCSGVLLADMALLPADYTYFQGVENVVALYLDLFMWRWILLRFAESRNLTSNYYTTPVQGGPTERRDLQEGVYRAREN